MIGPPNWQRIFYTIQSSIPKSEDFYAIRCHSHVIRHLLWRIWRYFGLLCTKLTKLFHPKQTSRGLQTPKHGLRWRASSPRPAHEGTSRCRRHPRQLRRSLCAPTTSHSDPQPEDRPMRLHQSIVSHGAFLKLRGRRRLNNLPKYPAVEF